MFQTHSVRFPIQLLKMLKERAAINHRSLGNEVIHIITQAIDRSVAEDQAVLRQMAEATPPRSE